MTQPARPLPDATGYAEALDQLIEEAGITQNRPLVRRLLETSLGLGTDGTSRLDLKIASAALGEMRDAYRLFQPHADADIVTIFGSARTREDDPLYRQARDVAAELAARGWMVVTGAGPGIMAAATEGAGADHALGVSIRLPFEVEPTVNLGPESLVEMRYFFTRKLMLVKESKGFICLPGGFGTMDEMFELLTLQQTGKGEPVPVVLLNAPGGTFWQGLETFVNETMVPAGVISADDFERAPITDSVDEAVGIITKFWSIYRSLRWDGDLLIFRLSRELTDAELASLNDRFAPLLQTGAIERIEPVAAEVRHGDALELPRIAFQPGRRAVGDLYQLIDAINDFGTA